VFLSLEKVPLLQLHPLEGKIPKQDGILADRLLGGPEHRIFVAEVVQGDRGGVGQTRQPVQNEPAERRVDGPRVKGFGDRLAAFSPKDHASRVRATEEVSPIFGRAAGGRALCRRALMETVLLLLEWKEFVGPLDDKEAFEERKCPRACVEGWPVDEVENLFVPLVVTAEVFSVGREPCKQSEL
jgi:hypothetical protein